MALRLDDAADLTAGDVVHTRFGALPGDATIADVREWFAQSPHRRMAFLADADRYRGSLVRDDLKGSLDPLRPAADVAAAGPTVAVDAPAQRGYDLAVLTDARRVPVVDSGGVLVGVLAVSEDLTAFCGVPAREGAADLA